MNINYDYYRIFYYVAKYESVSRAAKFLYSNQPNVTRTIKNLETQLGCTLFSRSSRGMKLTPEGKKLYSHIKIAFEHIFGVDLTIVDKLESQLEEPLNIYDFVVNKVFPEAIKVWSIDPNSLDPIPTISFKEYMQNWAKSFMPAGSANGLSWAMQ